MTDQDGTRDGRELGYAATRDSGSAGHQLRLLLVDDHEVVRQGLAAVLSRRDNFQVIAEAGTVADAVELADRFGPT